MFLFEKYKKVLKAVKIAAIILIPIFFLLGLIITVLAIIYGNSDLLIGGIAFTSSAVICLIIVPFILTYYKKIMLKDEKEFKLLKSKGDENNDVKI